SFMLGNHHSALQHPLVIEAYIQEELDIDRFSSPFLQSEVEDQLGSHFRSSLLTIVEKARSPGKFHVMCNLSYKDETVY
ncbi:uncharacterized protein LAESUDRAFT_653197, partial [Laetiporus sulphureus 93-53]